jgi:hypothetical protein
VAASLPKNLHEKNTITSLPVLFSDDIKGPDQGIDSPATTSRAAS